MANLDLNNEAAIDPIVATKPARRPRKSAKAQKNGAGATETAAGGVEAPETVVAPPQNENGAYEAPLMADVIGDEVDGITDDLARDEEAEAEASYISEAEWQETMAATKNERLPLSEDNPFRNATTEIILAAIGSLQREEQPAPEELKRIKLQCRWALEAAIGLGLSKVDRGQITAACKRTMHAETIADVRDDMASIEREMRERAKDMSDAASGNGGIPWLNLMNRRYAEIDGTVVRLNLSPAEIAANGALITPVKSNSFDIRFLNKIVTTYNQTSERTEKMPMNKAWLAHPDRGEYDKIGMWPVGKTPARAFNLWNGFAVEAEEKDWSLTKDYLLNVICSGNHAHYRYLEQTLAMWVRFPFKKAEITIALVSGQGAGKGHLYTLMRHIFGRAYCLATASAERLFGKFNTHLAGRLIVLLDECTFGGNRALSGPLKNKQTDDTLVIEGKGADIITTPNHLHFIVASNEAMALPLDLDDRRNFVLEVSSIHAKDTVYFAALNKAWEEEGEVSGFLHYLLHELKFDADFDPRNAPMTAAKIEIIDATIPAVQRFIIDLIESGGEALSDNHKTDRKNWEEGKTLTISKIDLRNDQINWHKENAGSDRLCGTKMLTIELGRILGATVNRAPTANDKGKRPEEYTIPPLAECLATIKEKYKR
jgi:hypothetical protein